MKPVALYKVVRLFGTPVAETILARAHVRAHQQAEHMDASDLIKTLQSGSAHNHPAAIIKTPAMIVLTDPMRSPMTCSQAPRIFRSCLRPV